TNVIFLWVPPELRPLDPWNLDDSIRDRLHRLAPRIKARMQADGAAMLAFQPELHPDYDRTIGALTGRRAAPDKGRDCLAEWEERLAFEQKYRGEKDETAMRTLHIVTLFQRLDAPSRMVA
ncbi:MAG: hypothetical protein QF830_09345, partial [Rhodospirillales bacterium]|nr:hypothetical protein [Rhodospirillales bacterium]